MQATKALFNRARKSAASKISSDVPYLLFLMVFTNIFFYSMQQTMVFSFLPKWVKSFGVDEVDVGSYAGIIASAIYIGNCSSSLVWGYISGTLSKKGYEGAVFWTLLFRTLHSGYIAGAKSQSLEQYNFALLPDCEATMATFSFSGAGSLVATVVFGFSMSVTWATIGRGLQGTASGQIVVLKAFMGEVCSGDMLAYGMAVLMSAWAVGNIIGPSIGGWTAFPADQYPNVVSKDGVFGRFPALLPNIIIAVGLGVGIISTFIFFPKNMKNQTDSTTDFLNDQDNVGYGGVDLNHHIAELEDPKDPKKSSLTQRLKSSSIVRVLYSRDFSLCSLLYLLIEIGDIGLEEIFPVWASTEPAYKGLGFTPSDVGTVLLVTFICCIGFQLTLLPELNNYLGAKRYLIISNLVLVFVMPLLPLIAAIQNSTLKWVALILVLFVNRSCVFAELLAINVLINNSVESDLLGSANGVTNMMANVGRLIGPSLSGGIYSWSLTNIRGIENNLNALGFPLNQFFTFFVLSGVSILVAVIGAMLDDRLDQRNSETDR